MSEDLSALLADISALLAEIDSVNLTFTLSQTNFSLRVSPEIEILLPFLNWVELDIRTTEEGKVIRLGDDPNWYQLSLQEIVDLILTLAKLYDSTTENRLQLADDATLNAYLSLLVADLDPTGRIWQNHYLDLEDAKVRLNSIRP